MSRLSLPRREKCGWLVKRPGVSSTEWHCTLPFGHREPHKQVDQGGRIHASSSGFRFADVRDYG